jgi:hypothetical protein
MEAFAQQLQPRIIDSKLKSIIRQRHITDSIVLAIATLSKAAQIGTVHFKNV